MVLHSFELGIVDLIFVTPSYWRLCCEGYSPTSEELIADSSVGNARESIKEELK